VSYYVLLFILSWAYGVLLWEIFTLGSTPYPTVPHEKLLEALREGHRLGKPSYSSEEQYVVMKECWCYEPAERLTFGEIVNRISSWDQIKDVSL